MRFVHESLPQRVVFALGEAAAGVVAEVTELGRSSVLLITSDRGAALAEPVQAALEAAGLAVDAMQLSPTFRRTVAKRSAERILGDEVDQETLQAIQREIEDADLDPVPMGPPVDTPPDDGDEGPA